MTILRRAISCSMGDVQRAVDTYVTVTGQPPARLRASPATVDTLIAEQQRARRFIDYNGPLALCGVPLERDTKCESGMIFLDDAPGLLPYIIEPNP